MSGHPLSADLEHILARARPAWEELRGQRLFITGGTGFFDSWLLESLAFANDRLALGVRAVVLTRAAAAFAKKAPHLAARPDIQFHAGDTRDFAFPPGPFSRVIHAATAASARLNEENPRLMLDTIVGGTRRALDFAVQCGAQKFILTSSGAVYGIQPPDLARLPEDYPGVPDPAAPGSAYGHGKRAAEQLCADCAERHGLETKIARCFAFVGPYLPFDAHFAIGNFIRDAQSGGPIVVKGDGAPWRSYLYAADLAIWLWTILEQGAVARPYNVGSAHALTIADTAVAVSKALGGRNPVVISQKPVPGKPAPRYVPDTSRAEKELGLREWIGLEDAIQRSARWRSGRHE